MPVNRVAAGVLLTTAVVALASTALAQTSRGGGDGSSRLQAMLQQEQARRLELQRDNEKLKADQAKIEAQLAAQESRAQAGERETASLQSKLAEFERTNENVRSSLEQSRDQFKELTAKYREIATALQAAERQIQELEGSVVDGTARLDACSAKNYALYELNSEVLDYMEDDGFWERLARKEPFTQIKRVQLENLVDDFEYEAENLVMDDGSAR